MSRTGQWRVALTAVAATLATVAGVTATGSPSARAQGPAQEVRSTAHRATAQRLVDRLGGSGTAGVPAAQAAALTASRQESLTGDISFSVPSGTFQEAFEVSLGTSIDGAEIRYTTDGTLPTASSELFSEALTVTDSTQLRAQAFVDGEATGAPGTAVYTARTIDSEHDLPVVVIDDWGAGKPTKNGYKDAGLMIMDPKGATTTLGAAPSVVTRAGIKLRGQSSARYEKAPYRIELRDNQNEEADYPLLGMPADSDWVLRGPFPDKTLMRDAMAYGMARELGLPAPRFAFVEVYLKFHTGGIVAKDYQGVYLLDETVKVSKDRTDIAKLKPTDLTEPAISGGYMMKFNSTVADSPTVPCTKKDSTDFCWRDLELFEPKNPTTEQLSWISGYLRKFHDALHGEDPSNEETGYPAYIDVDAFVNRIILEELGKEVDAYARSMVLFKDRGGKLTIGPAWDYDLGFNSMPSASSAGTEREFQGWVFSASASSGTLRTPSDWWVKLMGVPAFQDQVTAKWKELRQGVLSDQANSDRVDALAEVLANAAERNFTRWPNLNSANVGNFRAQRSTTYEGQLTILKTWLTKRAAWLDTAEWKAPEDWKQPR